MKKNFLMFSCFLALFAAFQFAGCAASKNTGNAIKHGAHETGQEIGETVTDASITSAIKMKMADDELVSASKIDVDTEKGNVTLNGTVASDAEEARAIELAKQAEGVKSVKSNLTKRPK